VKAGPKVVLPLAVLSVGVVGAAALVATRPTVKTQAVEAPVQLVRVLRVQPQDVDLTVRTNGSVLPRTETDLMAEVSGTIVWVSPSLVSGGFFEAGEPLLRIDPQDYDLALERARAALQRAESQQNLAHKELERRKGLAARNVTSRAQLDSAVNAEQVTRAALRDARAALARAKLDRSRAQIVAPYVGRVRHESADVGQFVSRGQKIARVYAVDRAEVRLPIPDTDLAFLELPLTYRGEPTDTRGPEVRLRARFAGGEHEWIGRVVRTEGEIDPQTRMVHAVAQVENPYARGNDPDRPPLAVGLFVEASIQGRRILGAYVLPRSAVRDGDRVLVVDDESRLHFRTVQVLRADRTEAVIQSGLTPGERVCISPLEAVVDGMRVRVVGGEEAAGEGPS
jgi:RND family efflux transporter MFP subunit